MTWPAKRSGAYGQYQAVSKVGSLMLAGERQDLLEAGQSALASGPGPLERSG